MEHAQYEGEAYGGGWGCPPSQYSGAHHAQGKPKGLRKGGSGKGAKRGDEGSGRRYNGHKGKGYGGYDRSGPPHHARGHAHGGYDGWAAQQAGGKGDEGHAGKGGHHRGHPPHGPPPHWNIPYTEHEMGMGYDLPHGYPPQTAPRDRHGKGGYKGGHEHGGKGRRGSSHGVPYNGYSHGVHTEGVNGYPSTPADQGLLPNGGYDRGYGAPQSHSPYAADGQGGPQDPHAVGHSPMDAPIDGFPSTPCTPGSEWDVYGGAMGAMGQAPYMTGYQGYDEGPYANGYGGYPMDGQGMGYNGYGAPQGRWCDGAQHNGYAQEGHQDYLPISDPSTATTPCTQTPPEPNDNTSHTHTDHSGHSHDAGGQPNSPSHQRSATQSTPPVSPHGLDVPPPSHQHPQRHAPMGDLPEEPQRHAGKKGRRREHGKGHRSLPPTAHQRGAPMPPRDFCDEYGKGWHRAHGWGTRGMKYAPSGPLPTSMGGGPLPPSFAPPQPRGPKRGGSPSAVPKLGTGKVPGQGAPTITTYDEAIAFHHGDTPPAAREPCVLEDLVDADLSYTPGELVQPVVTLSNLTRCQIVIADAVDSVHVLNCTDSIIFIGPTRSSVVIDNCRGCSVSSVSESLKITASSNLDLSIYAAHPPILNRSQIITISPYTARAPLLKAMFTQSMLDPARLNAWSNVNNQSENDPHLHRPHFMIVADLDLPDLPLPGYDAPESLASILQVPIPVRDA